MPISTTDLTTLIPRCDQNNPVAPTYDAPMQSRRNPCGTPSRRSAKEIAVIVGVCCLIDLVTRCPSAGARSSCNHLPVETFTRPSHSFLTHPRKIVYHQDSLVSHNIGERPMVQGADAGKFAGFQNLSQRLWAQRLPLEPWSTKDSAMQLAQNSTSRRRQGVTVPLELFERLVGRSGSRAWRRCVSIRDNRGFVDSTLRHLASLDGFEPVSIWNIRQGVDRLHQTGMARFVFDKRTRTTRRWIDGHEVTDAGDQAILVSKETMNRLSNANGWGGRRKVAVLMYDKKATRPQNNESRTQEKSPTKKTTRPQNTENQEHKSEEKTEQNQQLSHTRPRPRPRTHARGERAINPFISPPLRGEERKGSGDQTAVAGTGNFSEESSEMENEKTGTPEAEILGLENMFGSNSKSEEIARDIFLTHPATPPYPTLKLIRVPAPPELDQHGSDEDHFRQIASTWTKALEARYGGRCFVFSKAMRNPKKSKYYKALTKAAQQFVAHEISPAAWIAFSFDVWHEYGKHPHDDPPPIPWVFDVKRISERRGWFRREAARYRGGRLLFSKAHRELVTRYTHMQSALAGLPIKSTDAEVKQTIEKYFPENLYNDLLNRANAVAEDIQKKLYDCLRSGDWLWSEDWQINE